VVIVMVGGWLMTVSVNVLEIRIMPLNFEGNCEIAPDVVFVSRFLCSVIISHVEISIKVKELTTATIEPFIWMC